VYYAHVLEKEKKWEFLGINNKESFMIGSVSEKRPCDHAVVLENESLKSK